MKRILLTYLITAISFLLIDSLWLGVLAANLYRDTIGHLMADSFNMGGAIAFYSVFIAGILYFVIFPSLKEREPSSLHTVVKGLALGALTYATYDLTNYATLKNWPLNLVFIDIAWGAFLTAAAGTIGFMVAKRMT